METKTVSNLSQLGGRALLSAMFISAGFGKIGAYAGTRGYMESYGIPGLLLPAVIVLELIGGIAVLVGLPGPDCGAVARSASRCPRRWSSTAISAIQCNPSCSPRTSPSVGGFLLLFAQGPGEWSLSAISKLRRVAA